MHQRVDRAICISVVIGISLELLAGFSGGRLNNIITLLLHALLAFQTILMVIALKESGFNLLADGLCDALEPRQRSQG